MRYNVQLTNQQIKGSKNLSVVGHLNKLRLNKTSQLQIKGLSQNISATQSAAQV